MASDGKVFTFEEVAKHNHKKDCWIIVSGKVYDVTPFLDDHPGGDEVLLLAAEKDATNDFEEVGHSLSARETMEKFYVGEIDASTIPAEPDYRTAPAPPKAPTVVNDQSGIGMKILQYLVPLLILGLAFSLQYLKKPTSATQEH